jgi:hypothetical protein
MSMLQKIKSAFVYVPVLTWMIFMLSIKSYGNSIEDMKALELFMNMMQYNKAEKEALLTEAKKDTNATNNAIDLIGIATLYNIDMDKFPLYNKIKQECLKMAQSQIDFEVRIVLEEQEIYTFVQLEEIVVRPKTIKGMVKYFIKMLFQWFRKASGTEDPTYRRLIFTYHLFPIKPRFDAQAGKSVMEYKILGADVRGDNIKTEEIKNYTPALFDQASKLLAKGLVNPNQIYKTEEEFFAMIPNGMTQAWALLKDRFPTDEYKAENNSETLKSTLKMIKEQIAKDKLITIHISDEGKWAKELNGENIKIDNTTYERIRFKNFCQKEPSYSDLKNYTTTLYADKKAASIDFYNKDSPKDILFNLTVFDAKYDQKIESLKKYLLGEENNKEDVYLDNVVWISQFDEQFKNETCWPNQCCNKTVKKILQENGVVDDERICIAVQSSDNEINTLISTEDFDRGLNILNKTIKNVKEGGKPVMVGVHYRKKELPGYINSPCNRSFHYILLVGKGFDDNNKKDFFYFIDVGRGIEYQSDATSKSNKLYVDKNLKFISGEYYNQKYTITEIRSNKTK